ncbi:alpha/beta hydrolase [Nocardia sp. NBC_00511]|uniref:alpha/beta hydrolase n=1 Tax=Nocardia sp. NBC_00511 TaxID=2903591 RepID=UPI0030E372F3
MPSPAMLEMMERLSARRGARPAGPPPIAELREQFTTTGLPPYPRPEDVVVTEIPDAGVPAFWIDTPDADPQRVLLFVHGGGFSLGSVRSHGELASRVGLASGTRVLFPEYRLAPEHPFPAAVDDVRAIWRWLREVLGAPAKSIAVIGDSAGANLLAGLLVALRAEGQDLPAAGVFLSPVLDLTGSGDSMTEKDGVDPIFTPGMIHGIFAGYLAGANPLSPVASPLFAPLTGLPPILVQVGSAELVLSDSERFYKEATAAGVAVELEVGEGLPHVYQAMRDTPEAAAATERIGEFLRQHL